MIKLLTISIAVGVILWISIILTHSYAQAKQREEATDYGIMIQRCIAMSKNVNKQLKWKMYKFTNGDFDQIAFEIEKECKRLGGMR